MPIASHTIPSEFVEALLGRIDIVDLINSKVKLKKAGNHYTACCPFHTEKTPSFIVFARNQNYHCFGCGAHGDAIHFLRAIDHLGYREAVETLANLANMPMPQQSGTSSPQSKKREAGSLALSLAQRFYEQQLKEHPQKMIAVEYLKNRGMTGQIAKTFHLGFSSAEFDGLTRYLLKEGIEETLLLELGLSVRKERGLRDKFRKRVMFPIFDHRDKIVGFGGRVLDDGLPKYLNSQESFLFHKGSMLYGLNFAHQSAKERLIIVEGYMDVIALHQHGFTNTVGTMGTAITPLQVKRLFQASPHLYFCFDGDLAGRKAAWRALTQLLEQLEDGLKAHFVFLPEEHDPDSFVRTLGKAAFDELLNKAVPLSEFFFHHQAQGLDLRTLDDKSIFATRCLQLIEQTPKGVFQNLMLQTLAQKIEMPVDNLINKDTKPEVRPVARVSHQLDKSKPLGLTHQLLQLLLHAPMYASRIEFVPLSHVVTEPHTALVNQVIPALQQNAHEFLTEFAGVGREDKMLLEALLKLRPILSPEKLEIEILALWRKLKAFELQARLDFLIAKGKKTSLSKAEQEDLNTLVVALKS